MAGRPRVDSTGRVDPDGNLCPGFDAPRCTASPLPVPKNFENTTISLTGEKRLLCSTCAVRARRALMNARRARRAAAERAAAERAE